MCALKTAFTFNTKPLTVILVAVISLLSSETLLAQRAGDNADQIRSRLNDTKELIDEEQSNISNLESQLEEAISDNDEETSESLRSEINEAYERLEELQELNRKLRDLQDDSVEDKPIVRRPGGVRRQGERVPNPSLGGLDGDDSIEKARQRYLKEKEERRRRAATPAPDFGGPASADENDRAGDRRAPRSAGSSKLRNLEDARDSLMDAGETELAERVQDAIDREERRIKEQSRDRDRDRDRDRGAAERPGRGGGPVQADGPARRPNRDRNRGDDGDELSELEDELDRLREKLKEMERSRNGNGDR